MTPARTLTAAYAIAAVLLGIIGLAAAVAVVITLYGMGAPLVVQAVPFFGLGSVTGYTSGWLIAKALTARQAATV